MSSRSSQDPVAGTSRESTASQSTWFYSNKEREWIFYFVSLARFQLDSPLFDNELTNEVIARTQSILDRASGTTKMLRIPSPNTIRSIWNSFWDENATIDVIQRKKKRFDDQVLIEAIEKVIEEYPKASTHEIALKLPPGIKGGSQANVWRVIKGHMHLHFYRKRKVQLLKEPDFAMRKEFAANTIALLRNGSLGLDKIIVSDEMIITVNRHFNRQNDGQWFIKGQQDKMAQLVTQKSYAEGVHMWVALTWRIGVVGPFFVDEINVEGLTAKEKGKSPRSLTGAKYARLIRDSILPEIYQSIPEHQVKQMYWWQQDGAGPHVTKEPLALLRSIFGNKIMSRKTAYQWPPRSPDLSPLDYSFWAILRKRISATNPQSCDEIKAAARGCKEEMNNYVKRILADFPVRLRACLESEGRHFEPWLKDFKKRVAKNGYCGRCAMFAYGNLCRICMDNYRSSVSRDRQLDAEQTARENTEYDDDADDVLEDIGDYANEDWEESF